MEPFEKIIPPFIINEGWDFIFFKDIQYMASFMEPWQFEDGNHDDTLYLDSRQQVLKFAVEESVSKIVTDSKVVFVGLDKEKKIDNAENLRFRLAKYISLHSSDDSFLNASWESLMRYVEDNLLPKPKERFSVRVGQMLRRLIGGVFKSKV